MKGGGKLFNPADMEKWLAERKERDRKLINETLDLMANIDEELVKEWILQRYPHGDELYS
jgi:hypothetical protein